jgi:hypothetical protein
VRGRAATPAIGLPQPGACTPCLCACDAFCKTLFAFSGCGAERACCAPRGPRAANSRRPRACCATGRWRWAPPPRWRRRPRRCRRTRCVTPHAHAPMAQPYPSRRFARGRRAPTRSAPACSAALAHNRPGAHAARHTSSRRRLLRRAWLCLSQSARARLSQCCPLCSQFAAPPQELFQVAGLGENPIKARRRSAHARAGAAGARAAVLTPLSCVNVALSLPLAAVRRTRARCCATRCRSRTSRSASCRTAWSPSRTTCACPASASACVPSLAPHSALPRRRSFRVASFAGLALRARTAR